MRGSEVSLGSLSSPQSLFLSTLSWCSPFSKQDQPLYLIFSLLTIRLNNKKGKCSEVLLGYRGSRRVGASTKPDGFYSKSYSWCTSCQDKHHGVHVLLPVGLGNPGCAGAEGLICPPKPSSSSVDKHGNHTDTYCTKRRLSEETKQSKATNLPITASAVVTPVLLVSLLCCCTSLAGSRPSSLSVLHVIL